jgi:spoIIIJ-associated protein
MDVENDRATVSIVGADLSQLVGKKGEVLDAIQELTRLAVTRETGERSRLMLDISGHRAGVKAKLIEVAKEAVAKAIETGEEVELKPMNAFERKVVHDAVGETGASSVSKGEEPKRRIVVLPA